MSSAVAIDAFWAWWAQANEAYARAFDTGSPLDEALLRAMHDHVNAIHPDLDWEFGAGEESRHHLCLSAHGDPTLRVIAERWRKRGPASDEMWEFYPSRQAIGGLFEERMLEIGEEGIGTVAVRMSEIVFKIEISEHRERVDVDAYHPVFASIESDDLCHRILLLALDNLLGEDGVERWIGAIELSRKPLGDARSWQDLLGEVERLAARATGERWALLQGKKKDSPIVVTLNTAIKRVDHLLFDMHVEVRVPFRGEASLGLPTGGEVEALHAMEKELVRSLGEHAVYIGHESGRGAYVIHLHVAEGGPARGILDRWSS